MSVTIMKRIRTLAISLSLSLTLFLFSFAPALTPKVSALSGSGFQASRIVDDYIFFDKNTMSTSDIQNFFNAKVPVCDTWHAGSGGNNPPFTCLKDYSQSIQGSSADAYCSGSVTSGTKSAAQIVYDVSQACNVNPKVLIVLLQKEQALVTDTWPWNSQYQAATGYGCPDTAACDSQYYGFFNQVYNAARQFQRYVKQPGSFNYAVGRNSFVAYQANAPSCGGTTFTMQTASTAALYNYTPYQPNAAALNNLYGTGDSCSAYGNRNFWRLFNDWFGPTTSDANSDVLSFIRLNHGSGNVESVGYSSISNYSYPARYNLSNYPAVPGDGNVVPLFWPNGDLVLLRLNHSSGNVELVSYSASSGFKQIVNLTLTGYPAVPGDGNVVPLFKPNGDLCFIRLNHGSGNVEVVTYSVASNYTKPSSIDITSYPAVPGDGNVVPLFWPNGDLVFARLNHTSGNVEIVSYKGSSGYKQLANIVLTGYPAVLGDGAVVPMFKPNGNLSFVRLNHSSGNVEVVTYNANGNYQSLVDIVMTAYPAVTPDGSVVPLFTR